MNGPYDPSAVSSVEHELALIAVEHPEYADVVERATGLLSSMWARLAMVRNAVK